MTAKPTHGDGPKPGEAPSRVDSARDVISQRDRDSVTPPASIGHRAHFTTAGLTLSYLDYGGTGPVLLALHGHLNEARFVEQGAAPLDAGYRVIALDQRGHGESEHATTYATDSYVDDALALLDHLGIGSAVMLGHSLGGVAAYLLAARAPDRVTGLIVVDIGAVIDDDLSFVQHWPRRAPTQQELIDALGFMGPKHSYVMRHYPDGWGLPSDGDDMAESQRELNGDHWQQWLSSTAPALLLHGTRSAQLTTEHSEQMAGGRPNTTLVHIDAGHAIYVDNPDEYTAAISGFLAELPHRPIDGPIDPPTPTADPQRDSQDRR